jgi:hypothetical protein
MPAPVIPPAGVSPAGFFVPVTYVAPGEPVGILADPIDPRTGEYLSLERGFDPTDAAVLTALRTVRGSGSAVLEVGQRFQDATHVTDATATFLFQEVELALRHLVHTGQIRLERVSVVAEPGKDFAEAAIFYVNLARGEERIAVLPFAAQLLRAA